MVEAGAPDPLGDGGHVLGRDHPTTPVNLRQGTGIVASVACLRAEEAPAIQGVLSRRLPSLALAQFR
jgi:hypothetical protein